MRRCEGVKRSNLQENNGSTSTDECVSEIQQASTRQRVHGRDSGLWGAVLTGAGPLTVEPVLLPVVTIICHVKKAYCGLAQPPSGTQEKAGEINVSNIKGGRQCETTPWSASLSVIASFFLLPLFTYQEEMLVFSSFQKKMHPMGNTWSACLN